jgi:hypothetical protein
MLGVVVVTLAAAATFFVSYVPESGSDPAFPVASSAAGPHSKVVIAENTTFDFGKMSQRDESKHVWTIKNSGEANLEMWLDGKPSCSCTVAEFESDKPMEEGSPLKKVEVPPGESTRITIGWKTKEWKDSKYAQSATFGTNDPARPTFTLGVKGVVHPPIMIVPGQMISLQSVSSEDTTNTKFGMFSIDKPNFKITKVSTSRPAFIVATVHPMDADQRKVFQINAGYRVDIEVKPGMPIGAFHDEIVVSTDHPRQGELKIAIVGNVSGPISAFPERVRIPNVTRAEGITKDVSLLVRGDKETKFEVARKPERLEVAIVSGESSTSGRYHMRVTVPKGTTAGRIEGMIILKTDNPKAAELKIPVDIFVSNAGAS